MLKFVEICWNHPEKKAKEMFEKVCIWNVEVLDISGFWQYSDSPFALPALIFSFDWSKDRLWLASTKASWNIASNKDRDVQLR